jgi:hypothetical protein
MSDPRPTRDSLSIEAAMLMNIRMLPALLEELEPRSLFAKQDQLGLRSPQTEASLEQGQSTLP